MNTDTHTQIQDLNVSIGLRPQDQAAMKERARLERRLNERAAKPTQRLSQSTLAKLVRKRELGPGSVLQSGGLSDNMRQRYLKAGKLVETEHYVTLSREGYQESFSEPARLKAALACFKRRQDRTEHPEGEFDKAKRWYPIGVEDCTGDDCGADIRSPSRNHPYSLMLHCRTLRHVAWLFSVDESKLRKLNRKAR
ncbi:MAG: hypothetical protein ACYTFG_02235 [Planctomycetota bacterium]|jgi:hypothetical protein